MAAEQINKTSTLIGSGPYANVFPGLRTPWGRGKQRTGVKLDEVKINGFLGMIPDTHIMLNEYLDEVSS